MVGPGSIVLPVQRMTEVAAGSKLSKYLNDGTAFRVTEERLPG